MNQKYEHYYVPEQSPWPIVGAIGLFLIAFGAGLWVPQIGKSGGVGGYILLAGIATIIFMLFGWFRNVIRESMAGLYSHQMNRSFYQGMGWFIFSEVMFFFALFGVLFYLRVLSVPWLGGASNNEMTHAVLWPEFQAMWPLLVTPDGTTTEAMPWHGLPLYNTLILLTSSVTLHYAHVALERDDRKKLSRLLILTVALGVLFLFFQVEEYIYAYKEMGLTLDAGVYGNTFFLLTGFHGMHVTLGAIILFILWLRILRGHFTPKNHFAFQAGSWYWHFVDIVWAMLFVFVYIL